MNKKLEEKMVSTIIKLKLSWLYWINNSQELNKYSLITMKLKKQWKCIKNYISGMNQSKLQKGKDTHKLRN